LFHRIVPTLLREFQPELIVLQHGVDGHRGDALANLQYTPRAYAEIDRTVLQLSREICGGRLLVTGGGGYRASAVSRVLARTGLLLADLPPPEERDDLPEAWTAEYSETIGELAPKSWAEPEPPVPSPWSSQQEARLVGELEQRLGRKFPPVA
jgi:acetoin utilization protein AcuC